MSIVIASCTEKCVALCADCQHTNIRTGKPEDVDLKKIEALSDKLIVAHCGSAAMAELCMRVVRKLYADGNISESSVEETTNILKASYENGLLIHPELEERCTTKFVIAGKMTTGKFGFTVVEAEDNVVTVDVFDKPVTKIFGPADLSSKECVSILNGLVKSTPMESVPQYIENVCRKTVQLVSKLSKYVSFDSLFLMYSEY